MPIKVVDRKVSSFWLCLINSILNISSCYEGHQIVSCSKFVEGVIESFIHHWCQMLYSGRLRHRQFGMILQDFTLANIIKLLTKVGKLDTFPTQILKPNPPMCRLLSGSGIMLWCYTSSSYHIYLVKFWVFHSLIFLSFVAIFWRTITTKDKGKSLIFFSFFFVFYLFLLLCNT